MSNSYLKAYPAGTATRWNTYSVPMKSEQKVYLFFQIHWTVSEKSKGFTVYKSYDGVLKPYYLTTLKRPTIVYAGEGPFTSYAVMLGTIKWQWKETKGQSDMTLDVKEIKGRMTTKEFYIYSSDYSEIYNNSIEKKYKNVANSFGESTWEYYKRFFEFQFNNIAFIGSYVFYSPPLEKLSAGIQSRNVTSLEALVIQGYTKDKEVWYSSNGSISKEPTYLQDTESINRANRISSQIGNIENEEKRSQLQISLSKVNSLSPWNYVPITCVCKTDKNNTINNWYSTLTSSNIIGTETNLLAETTQGHMITFDKSDINFDKTTNEFTLNGEKLTQVINPTAPTD